MDESVKKPKFPLYLKILLGLVLGLTWGLCANTFGVKGFTIDYIKPWGDIFIRLLKMIAVPLVIASLITGVANLKDISKFSRMGIKTISLYLGTTVIAIVIGLIGVNLVKPGEGLSDQTKQELQKTYKSETTNTVKNTNKHIDENKSPLEPLKNMVPDNIVSAFSNNRLMLQTVFFAVFFGIVLLYLPKEQSQLLTNFFEAINAAIIKMIDFIMEVAPIGVFALIAAQIAAVPSIDLLKALGAYSLTVVGSLVGMLIVYASVITLFTPLNPWKFFRGIFPAQLLAFSSSSSSATLPLTMKQVEGKLGVQDEVSSFVLPLGATVNMDGTSLYQAIAAVFIAQVYGIELDLAAQIGIVLTALLSSIGAAGVPGAGMILLGVILSQQGIPLEGIALIMAPDRLLDMCRTTINVTGDATVATVVAHTEKKLYHVK